MSRPLRRLASLRTPPPSRLAIPSRASPAASTSRAMHKLARSGFDASGSSGLYDRARPSYPLEAINTILLSPFHECPDLAAGAAVAAGATTDDSQRGIGPRLQDSRGDLQGRGPPPPGADDASATLAGRGMNIVEIGSGTGICTRMLLSQSHALSSRATLSSTQTSTTSAPPSSTYAPPPTPPSPTPFLPSLSTLTAVEPSAGMRSHFRRHILDASIPEMRRRGVLAVTASVECVEGTFEDFSLPGDAAAVGQQDVGRRGGARSSSADGEIDLVVVAQAWHWCPSHDAALSRIARALRPGGTLALLWNLEDRDAAEWVAACRDVYERYEDGTPQYRHHYWRAMYACASFGAHFHPCTLRSWRRALPTSVEGVVERVLSKSYVTVLEPRRRDEVRAEVEAVFRGMDVEEAEVERRGGGPTERGQAVGARGRRWIDRERGVFEFPYRTDLVLLRKNGASCVSA